MNYNKERGELLSNPIWHALGSRQQHFNRGNDTLRYFPEEVAPFVGLPNWNADDVQLLSKDLPRNRSFYILIEKQIHLPDKLDIKFTLPLYQMECNELHPEFTDNPVKRLGEEHISQMLELTSLTRPGPFHNKTISLGNYIGIFDGERLIAMGGERLKVPGFTEISAICTHPDYRGKMLASHIISLLSQQIFDKGEIPFLHTRTDNSKAISVYEKLGYKISRDIFFAIIEKK